ncbi:CocE/NonD family hydrolase C-terminal non-catalytic domain-containing protein [Streptomyces sp. Tue6028]|uniref:CocE/NonD family hydrolase C-terminal non-catalytic domain-containing protein n=1 Tax=Streptomyces sp. Tue6028 TaxID=2036037 RepID=UPI003D745D31
MDGGRSCDCGQSRDPSRGTSSASRAPVPPRRRHAVRRGTRRRAGPGGHRREPCGRGPGHRGRLRLPASFAEIDQADTNFILRLWDEVPDGGRQPITTGYLKASHRELDEERTTEGNPYHPHTRAVPVEPGKIEEYVLRLYPFAATFRPGHHLTVELSNDEPLADAHNALLPPDTFHLPVGRPVTHKIYRDAAHPSRLVLPFTAATTPDAAGPDAARADEGARRGGS